MPLRVVVGMSGGVDSSVAAARLQDAGLEVLGATLRLAEPDPVGDARGVADQLGIAHHVLDWRAAFERRIASLFVDTYLRGQTPSPCVHCNRLVKLPALLDLADRLGADLVATGHYARLDPEGPSPRLYRARDRARDQSYFLQWLSSDVRSRLRLPLGDSTKTEVRVEARRRGLAVADKDDSLELCFVPEGHYTDYVAARAGDRLRPGPLLDEAGREVGRHAGVHAFTIGQRRNLGVALGRRAFVVGLDAERGAVQLGSREDVLASGAVLEQVRLDDDVELPIDAEAVIRYHAPPVGARVEALSPECAEVRFAQPVAAVVPGQFAAIYSGDRLLGGGMIREALAVRPDAG